MLSGCGEERYSEEDGRGKQNLSVRSTTSATPPTPAQAAFTALLDEVARACAAMDAERPATTDRHQGGGPAEPRTARPTGRPEAARSLGPGETPPDGPVEPGVLDDPASRLNDRDHCASTFHEQRIIEALQTVSRPTPARVRATLNGLGYMDARIHGLVQDGTNTRFSLDLSERGSRLCEAGVAAGDATDVTVCASRADGQGNGSAADAPQEG